LLLADPIIRIFQCHLSLFTSFDLVNSLHGFDSKDWVSQTVHPLCKSDNQSTNFLLGQERQFGRMQQHCQTKQTEQLRTLKYLRHMGRIETRNTRCTIRQLMKSVNYNRSI